MYYISDEKPICLFKHEINIENPTKDIFAVISFSGTQYKVRKVFFFSLYL